MHPDWTVKVYPLERLTKLYDGIEQLEDLWDDDNGAMDDSHDYNDEVWSMNEHGLWETVPADEDGWEEFEDDGEDGEDDYDDSMEVDSRGWADENMADLASPSQLVQPIPLPHLDTHGSQDASVSENQPVSSGSAVSSSTIGEVSVNGSGSDEQEEPPWKRFDILSSAPADHAFFSSPPATPSKSFLGRLTKEYRVLASSLPGEPYR